MIGKVLIAACLVLPVAALAANERQLTPQQQKMTDCNKQAGDKKLHGDERKAFLSSCLKADSHAAAGDKKPTPQQQKMTDCNKQAGSRKLAGDEREQFMSTCLKG
ncbi:MAG TPA: PsiF family protein [Burkholderiaceae bacterium]|nr:PsiF family protein [Burkholderiaceae bacterium]